MQASKKTLMTLTRAELENGKKLSDSWERRDRGAFQ